MSVNGASVTRNDSRSVRAGGGNATMKDTWSDARTSERVVPSGGEGSGSAGSGTKAVREDATRGGGAGNVCVEPGVSGATAGSALYRDYPTQESSKFWNTFGTPVTPPVNNGGHVTPEGKNDGYVMADGNGGFTGEERHRANGHVESDPKLALNASLTAPSTSGAGVARRSHAETGKPCKRTGTGGRDITADTSADHQASTAGQERESELEPSELDPDTFPAVMVTGFKLDPDDPQAASSMTTRVMAHCQKGRHGGGEVVGGCLLDCHTMRVAFERKDGEYGCES